MHLPDFLNHREVDDEMVAHRLLQVCEGLELGLARMRDDGHDNDSSILVLCLKKIIK